MAVPPPEDFGPVDYEDLVGGEHEERPAAPESSRAAAREPLTVAAVLEAWRADGPLVHEPTGIKGLDERTGGGPVYGTRWYFPGAPDAGKTALLVQVAHEYATRGVIVGMLAVDEEAGDLVTRLAQRIGYARYVCEVRPADTLRKIGEELGSLPFRFYDDTWTIDAAAADLAEAAKRADGRAALIIDSLQTVSCEAENLAALAGREMSEVAAVTARVKTIRAVATRYRQILLVTSEMGRGAYRSRDPEQQTSTLAAAKWSGAVEYSGRVIVGVRSVPGEKDLLEIELAKNKHRPADAPEGNVYLRIDRRCQVLTEADYTPDPTSKTAGRDALKREQVTKDAAAIAQLLLKQPGLSVRRLRAAASSAYGLGQTRVDNALEVLGDAVQRGEGPRGSTPLSLRLEMVPREIRTLVEVPNA